MKACTVRLLPALLLLVLPVVAEAQFTYTTNNGVITLTKYTGPGGAVTIPSETNGWPVTTIGTSCFFNCSSLTSVTIPDSIVSIQGWAFGATGLTNVTIPNGVTNIGNNVFYYCYSLRTIAVGAANPNYCSVDGVLFNKDQTILLQYPQGRGGNYTIPNSVISIGRGGFYYCSGLTTVTIPTNVSSIGSSAFSWCTNLTTVTIPASVTNMQSYAFASSGLTTVTIPTSITNILDDVFDECRSLTNVTIPNSVTRIGNWVFDGCTSLRAITVGAANPNYCSVDGVLFNKDQTVLVAYPAGRSGGYTIPNTVTNIGTNAFCECDSLTSVMIPNSVRTIGYEAFQACSSLTNVTMAGPIASIGNLAFAYCYDLAALYFYGNAPTLGGSTVFNSSSTTIVYYLPGTTGWSARFGGTPTSLWTLPYPLILNSGASFGVQTSGFGFTISWATNVPVVVEASTTLAPPGWAALQTCALTNGSAYFSDPQWTNYPSRFYRLRSP